MVRRCFSLKSHKLHSKILPKARKPESISEESQASLGKGYCKRIRMWMMLLTVFRTWRLPPDEIFGPRPQPGPHPYGIYFTDYFSNRILMNLTEDFGCSFWVKEKTTFSVLSAVHINFDYQIRQKARLFFLAASGNSIFAMTAFGTDLSCKSVICPPNTLIVFDI